MPDTFLHTAYSVSLKSTARRPSYGDPDHIRQTVPDRALVAGVTDDAGVSWAMSTSGLSSHHVSGARTLGTLRRCEIVAPPGVGRDLKVCIPHFAAVFTMFTITLSHLKVCFVNTIFSK